MPFFYQFSEGELPASAPLEGPKEDNKTPKEAWRIRGIGGSITEIEEDTNQ
jgi:hypothetical protein